MQLYKHTEKLNFLTTSGDKKMRVWADKNIKRL